MSNIEKIKAEIERLRKENGKDGRPSHVTEVICTHLLAFIDSLPEETSCVYDTNGLTPTPSVNIEDVARVQFASHAHVFDRKRKAVFDWEQFKEVAGVFYGFGKRDSLPEEPLIPSNSVELEEEINNYFRGLWPGIETAEQCNTDLHFTPPAIMRLACHFAEWGAKCKDSLQVQETCKENQDSFTDEPKELEEAANEWILSHNDGDVLYVKNAFKDGAKWMANQMLGREDRNDDTLPRYYGD